MSVGAIVLCLVVVACVCVTAHPKPVCGVFFHDCTTAGRRRDYRTDEVISPNVADAGDATSGSQLPGDLADDLDTAYLESEPPSREKNKKVWNRSKMNDVRTLVLWVG